MDERLSCQQLLKYLSSARSVMIMMGELEKLRGGKGQAGANNNWANLNKLSRRDRPDSGLHSNHFDSHSPSPTLQQCLLVSDLGLRCRRHFLCN